MMKTYRKLTSRIIAAALSLMMLLALIPASVSAAGLSTAEIYRNVGDNLAGMVEEKPVYKMDWYVTDLARAGRMDSKAAEKYLQSVKENAPADTGSSKTALVFALTALGEDASSFDGVNYLDDYKTEKSIENIGYSSTEAYILASIDCGNYWDKLKAAGGDASPEKIVKHLLSQQQTKGGWGYVSSGTEVFDADTTAMVIQGLAPYYSSNADVKTAVDKALDLLGKAQDDNGSFVSWGSENSATVSQVIIALTSLGKDPDKDARFVKNGTLMDALTKCYVDGGSFSLAPGENANSYASYQGYMAMNAYYRLKNGENAFFDMTDAEKKMTVTLTAEAGSNTEVGRYTKLKVSVKDAKGALTYKFIVHNETTDQWYKIRDFGSGNSADWYTGPAGQKTLYVDVMTNGDLSTVVRAAFPINVNMTALKVGSFTSSGGTSLSVYKNTVLSAKASGGTGTGYVYKFIVHNETTDQWYKIRDWSGYDQANWYTGPKGKKVLYADVRDSAGNYVRQPLGVTVK